MHILAKLDNECTVYFRDSRVCLYKTDCTTSLLDGSRVSEGDCTTSLLDGSRVSEGDCTTSLLDGSRVSEGDCTNYIAII